MRHGPFVAEKYKGASRCPHPICEICQYAKNCTPIAGTTTKSDHAVEGHLKDGNLHPSHHLSADHFESRLLGRTFSSYGADNAVKYKGGCVFIDHMSGYIHPELQAGLFSSETIRAKQNFERMLCLDHGVIVDSYLPDNGTFKANTFVSHIQQHNQLLQFCGVNAHHINDTHDLMTTRVDNFMQS